MHKLSTKVLRATYMLSALPPDHAISFVPCNRQEAPVVPQNIHISQDTSLQGAKELLCVDGSIANLHLVVKVHGTSVLERLLD